MTYIIASTVNACMDRQSPEKERTKNPPSSVVALIVDIALVILATMVGIFSLLMAQGNPLGFLPQSLAQGIGTISSQGALALLISAGAVLTIDLCIFSIIQCKTEKKPVVVKTEEKNEIPISSSEPKIQSSHQPQIENDQQEIAKKQLDEQRVYLDSLKFYKKTTTLDITSINQIKLEKATFFTGVSIPELCSHVQELKSMLQKVNDQKQLLSETEVEKFENEARLAGVLLESIEWQAGEYPFPERFKNLFNSSATAI